MTTENLSIKNGDETQAHIVWDRSKGNARITVGTNTFEFKGSEIRHFIGGADEVLWSGSRLVVTRYVHESLAKDFPAINAEREYTKADEWAVRKDRTIKNAYSFLLNWFAKSGGGKVERGGVIY